MGVCPQLDVLWENLTVREHLEMFLVFKGLPPSEHDRYIEEQVTNFGFTKYIDENVRTLSGGWKRKLSVAIALVGGSDLVFLDEPSSGMDITGRRELWNILKNQKKGRVIILTTH
jgi:ATP-binding cassette subfamily A (ABC1) protein 3